MEKDHQNRKLISVAQILQTHCNWIRAREFEKLVADKKKVSQRQARNIIKREYVDGKILKHKFSDGAVIYGVTEFGPPVFTADVLKQVNAQFRRWTEEQRRKEDSYRTGIIP